MNDIIRANYEMTAEECDLYVNLFHKAESDQRFYLLKIREEKGWKAKGFLSFDDFGKQMLGCDAPRLYQLAKAAEIHLSLPDYTNGIKISERTLRPLGPLTDTERQQVWAEATAVAKEENRKLTAKLVQEAVDRLQAEKAQLQATLELTEQRTSDWRLQALDKEKALKELDQKAKIAQTEAASLRRTLAMEAEKLAEAKILEVRAALNAEKDKAAKLAASVKSLKNEREDAINRGVSNKLREQQQEIDAKEGQLVAIEKRIAFLRQELDPMDEEHEAIARHAPRIAKVDHLINSIAVELSDAFDPDYCQDLPESLIRKWEAGSKKIGQLQDMLNIYINGAPINE